MKSKTSFIWVYGKIRNHKLKIRNQQDVAKIKRKVEGITYSYRSPNTGRFHITLEFKNNPNSKKIKQEIREILKGEFLDKFLESSGQSPNTALSSPIHLEKEETRK